MGRLSEAIEAWQQTGRASKLNKYAKDQIVKLESRIKSVEKGTGGNAIAQDIDDDDDGSFQGR